DALPLRERPTQRVESFVFVADETADARRQFGPRLDEPKGAARVLAHQQICLEHAAKGPRTQVLTIADRRANEHEPPPLSRSHTAPVAQIHQPGSRAPCQSCCPSAIWTASPSSAWR